MTDATTVAPAGTQLSPRKNLGAGERGLSVLVGAGLGIAAAQKRGGIGAALGLAGSVLLARGLTGASPAKRLLAQRPDETAVAKAAGWSSAALVSRAVTINARRSVVFARLRDFAAWPAFSVNVLAAEDLGGGRWRWTAMSPGGPVTWEATIEVEEADSVIALTSCPGTPVPITSRFELRDAPGGRGTEIHGTIAYEPPGGSVARYAAKLGQREPGIQLRRDLKRLKSLIETGEIATNAPQGTTPKA